MQRWLLLLFLFITQITQAQRGFLYVKKSGYKKVKTFAEGDPIQFKTDQNQTISGMITLIKRDSLRVNGYWYRTGQIKSIILRGKQKTPASPLLLTTAGVALSTAGMTLANWADFKEALAYSSVIGYGNYIIRFLPKIKRRKYDIGRKFSLHTLDLHF